MLARIQNDLFDLGADLCVPGSAADRLRLTEGVVGRLEAEVRQMNAVLPPLTSFILPGGHGCRRPCPYGAGRGPAGGAGGCACR